MAKPQLENGYTRIANDIMDALVKTRIPGEARQVLDFIIRKTYGYGKKDDSISLSQFTIATGMKKPTISRAINKLLSMNIIIKNDNGYIGEYRFNKNFDQWKPLSKKIKGVSKKIITVIKKDNWGVSKKIPTKDNITKDNITKESIMSEFLKILGFAPVKKNLDALWKAYGGDEILKMIKRAEKYWQRESKVRKFRLTKRWKKFYENISIFLSDESLHQRITDERAWEGDNRRSLPGDVDDFSEGL